MILLNHVVHIFAGANGNRFASVSKPALCIALHYSYSIGLASINGYSHWPAVAGQSFADEALSGSQITLLAEIELNRITIAINRTI